MDDNRDQLDNHELTQYYDRTFPDSDPDEEFDLGVNVMSGSADGSDFGFFFLVINEKLVLFILGDIRQRVRKNLENGSSINFGGEVLEYDVVRFLGEI